MGLLQIYINKYNNDFLKHVRYQLPYVLSNVEKIECNDHYLIIHVPQQNEEELAAMHRTVEEFISKQEIEFDCSQPSVIFKNERVKEINISDIYGELIRRNWIVEFEKGVIGYGGEFNRLIKLFDRQICILAQQFEAEEYSYPGIIDMDTLSRCQYITQFPHHAMFVSHLKEDLHLINEFTQKHKKGEDCYNNKYIMKPQHINKTSICVHVYKQYENKKIDLKSPIAITSIGRCNRFESLNMTKAERLLDFTMREIVFIGSKEYVLECRKICLSWLQNWIIDLDLEATIQSSNDPFFSNEYRYKKQYQKKFKVKYEINVTLPYIKDKISIGSLNYHNTFFSNAFQIISNTGDPIHTGCIGFGLERLAYAFLCQNGLKSN